MGGHGRGGRRRWLRQWAGILTAAAVLLPAAAALPAQELGSGHDVPLSAGSHVILEGTASTGDWECRSTELRAELRGPADLEDGRPAGVETAFLHLPVGGIRCGLTPMERDLRRALQADRHPRIVFRIQDVEPGDAIAGGPGTEFGVEVAGDLTVAGVRRPLAMTVGASVDPSGPVRLEASTRIAMSDFGVEPPTAMLGLIRAGDTVSVTLRLRTDLRAVADRLEVEPAELMERVMSWTHSSSSLQVSPVDRRRRSETTTADEPFEPPTGRRPR